MVSEEIEYIEPTQEHVGQMVQVRDTDGQPWIHCELLAVLPTKVPYRFCCYHEPNGSKVRAWEFARIPRPKPQSAQEPQPVKPIDWTKPVRTKDGRAVRVVCTDAPGSHPIIGIVEGVREPFCWEVTGVYEEGVELGIELENVPQRIQREYWVNVYQNGLGTAYETKYAAGEARGTQCLACVKITIDCEEGEGL